MKSPRKFFEEIKSEGKGYLKPFSYMLIAYIIYIAGSFLGFFFLPVGSDVLAMSISLITGLAVFYIILTIVFMLIYFGSMHLAVRIVKGKGNFNQTFKVICYSYSPFNFVWIFVLIMIAAISLKSTAALLIALLMMLPLLAGMLYVFYILVVGISITSEISGGRAFAALMIQLIIYSVVIFSLIFGAVFLYSFSETPYSYSSPRGVPDYYETPYKTEPVRYNITVFAGSTPIIDGSKDDEDKWYEGEPIRAEARGKSYTITTKHDFESIYILMQWNSSPEWRDDMHIYFEQDEEEPDHNWFNGRVDSYYQGYGQNSLLDAHGPGYVVSEEQNGNLKGGYKDGLWTLEWKIPLQSGDDYDIYIDKYPAQVGFSIINWGDGVARGIWPPNADPYQLETWG
ncbi:MAG: YIP1 family protein, partial [Candidatus Methanoperedens sp.]